MVFFRLQDNRQLVNVNQIVTMTYPDPAHFADNYYRAYLMNGRVILITEEEAHALFKVIDIQSVTTVKENERHAHDI